VNAVAFSRDGDKFATGGSDRQVRLGCSLNMELLLNVLFALQLLVWQSNLHTYDASQFEAKSALASSGCDTSAVSSKQSLASGTSKSNDLSIRIDPRQSQAYQLSEENFQVLDSKHSNQPQNAQENILGRGMDFKPQSPRFF